MTKFMNNDTEGKDFSLSWALFWPQRGVLSCTLHTWHSAIQKLHGFRHTKAYRNGTGMSRTLLTTLSTRLQTLYMTWKMKCKHWIASEAFCINPNRSSYEQKQSGDIRLQESETEWQEQSCQGRPSERTWRVVRQRSESSLRVTRPNSADTSRSTCGFLWIRRSR